MKNKILFISMLICFSVFSQNRTIDSLYIALKNVQTDTDKIYILYSLANEYQSFSPDTTLLFSQQALKMSDKINYLDGLSVSANIIGTVYLQVGNYSKAIEYYIRNLKIEEKRNNPGMLAISNMSLSGVYLKEGNFKKAFNYAFVADSIINANNLTSLKLYSLLNLGDMYEKEGKILTALDYTQKAYALAVKENNINFEGASLNNLGNIYAKMGNSEFAIQNYSKAIPYLETTHDDGFTAESSLGLAKQYMAIGKYDSSLFYGLKSYELSKRNGYLSKQLDASIFLTKFYKSKNDIKNAFIYQEDLLTIKDSIFSKERIAKSQILSMEEELRQKEIAEKKIEEAEERRVKIQYLMIGLILPILFFVTLYMSNRKIKPKYIEFLGVVSLLLTFEFIMLLLHPVIVSVTNHMPFYELFIFAVIASVLTPLHHNIRNWLVKILTKKERISLMKIRIQ